jgi:ectoine hydroxylase-related dioxygenase (phytanoyl-CoA dioxygenase family)
MGGEQQTTSVLTREQRDKWDRDGYLVLEDTGCADLMLDAIVSELEPLYDREEETPEGVGFQRHRIRNAWHINENVRALALSPRVLAALEELYGRKPRPFQTLNFRKGTQQRAHSDGIHFNTDPPGFMCGVWVALEDMDMDNGTLVYYPGSHKLPLVRMNDVGVAAEREQYPKYEEHIQTIIEERDLQPEYAIIRKGNAIMWSANILHGGAPQRDLSRTRLSQVTHYYFEDCRYYNPMLSGSDKESWHWYEPLWVT